MRCRVACVVAVLCCGCEIEPAVPGPGDGGVDGGPGDDACPGGACAETCLPDGPTCEGDQLVGCGPDGGSRVVLAICELGCTIDATTGASACRVCTCDPGDSRCVSGTSRREYCRSDCLAWVVADCAPDDCREVPNGTGGQEGRCVVCLEGSGTRCDGVSIVEYDGCEENVLAVCELGCDDNGGTPACRVCEPGTTSCDGDTLLTCSPSGLAWSRFACVGGCGEDSGTPSCLPTACEPGATRCADDKLMRCRDDGTGEELASWCEVGCDLDHCRPCVCTASFPRCASPTSVETCAEDCSDWLPSVPCADGSQCLNGSCVP